MNISIDFAPGEGVTDLIKAWEELLMRAREMVAREAETVPEQEE